MNRESVWCSDTQGQAVFIVELMRRLDRLEGKKEPFRKLSPEDVKKEIAWTATFNAAEASNVNGAPVHCAAALVTICVMVLKNGTVVVGKAICGDPSWFDESVGCEMAWKDAFDQVYPLLYHAMRG